MRWLGMTRLTSDQWPWLLTPSARQVLVLTAYYAPHPCTSKRSLTRASANWLDAQPQSLWLYSGNAMIKQESAVFGLFIETWKLLYQRIILTYIHRKSNRSTIRTVVVAPPRSCRPHWRLARQSPRHSAQLNSFSSSLFLSLLLNILFSCSCFLSLNCFITPLTEICLSLT